MQSRLIQNVLGARLSTIAYGDGVWLYDADGRAYIDAASGAVVTSLGHGNHRIIEAMAAQARRVTFTHRGVFNSQAADLLADRLGELADYAGVWFVNSGSEAVEAAMQFALQFHRESGRPQRRWFLSHRHGYHGNTLGGLSLSGHIRRSVAGDLALPFNLLPEPFSYRDAHDLDDSEYTARLLAQAEQIISRHSDQLAGVVVEPVGGATLGATVPPMGYLEGLARLCREHGGLFITDEVMTGLGRCGHVLAANEWGVRADLVALGKGLSAGYTPIAATLVSGEILAALRSGTGHIYGGHTFAGNPLSVATGLAVLEEMERTQALNTGRARAAVLRTGLERIARRHPMVGEVRGLGMLMALELVTDRTRRRSELPQGELAAALARTAMAEGVVLYPATGGFNDAVLVAPPLLISEDEVADLIARLDRALLTLPRQIEPADCRDRPPTSGRSTP